MPGINTVILRGPLKPRTLVSWNNNHKEKSILFTEIIKLDCLSILGDVLENLLENIEQLNRCH